MLAEHCPQVVLQVAAQQLPGLSVQQQADPLCSGLALSWWQCHLPHCQQLSPKGTAPLSTAPLPDVHNLGPGEMELHVQPKKTQVVGVSKIQCKSVCAQHQGALHQSHQLEEFLCCAPG
jgi:hypothetical protein